VSRRAQPKRTRLSVQVPAELRRAMEAAARADHRKLSSWVVHVLSGAVAAPRKGR